jgi:hypothetical protein
VGELSKTAKASMVQVPKEKKAEESTEEAIRQIRIERQAGIWPSTSRIDKLLAAYDKFREDLIYGVVVEEVKKLEDGHSIKITKVHDEISVEPVTEMLGVEDFAAFSPANVVMAELSSQEEDPHHMVDFGHHTTHSVSEGA